MPKPPSGPACACGHTMATYDPYWFECCKCGARLPRVTGEELEALRERRRQRATDKQSQAEVVKVLSAPDDAAILPGRLYEWRALVDLARQDPGGFKGVRIQRGARVLVHKRDTIFVEATA